MAKKSYTNNQKKRIRRSIKYKIKQTGKEDKEEHQQTKNERVNE